MAGKRIHRDVFKNGLDGEFNSTDSGAAYAIHLLGADITDIEASGAYSTAIATWNGTSGSLGSGVVNFNAAESDGNDGMKVVQTAAINDASVSATGTAIAYAVVRTDTGKQKVLAIGNVTDQALTLGNTFDLAAITITLPFTAVAPSD